MSSLASHTMAPAWTMLGRLTPTCCCGVSAKEAVATGAIIALPAAARPGGGSGRAAGRRDGRGRAVDTIPQERFRTPVPARIQPCPRPLDHLSITTETPMASSPAPAGHEARSGQRALSVLLYSDDSEVRASVRLAVGRRPAPDLPVVRWTEVAAEAAALAAVDAGGLDVLVLDGEAVPAGGMGLCKQLKDEIYHCPPVLVLIGRPADAWLATWSRADLVVPHPLDPVAVAEAVAELARRRLHGAAPRRRRRP